MTTGQKQDARGGARAGSGRKPGGTATVSAVQVEKMLRTARKYRKKYGKTIDDVLLGFIYGETDKDGVVPKISDRVTCIKVYKEYTIAKMQEGGETDKALGPSVFLPEQRPQLSVVPKKDVA